MATSDIHIRRATEQDIDALLPLFDGYRRFYRTESDLDATRRFLLERLLREPSYIFLALATPPGAGREAAAPAGMVRLYPTLSGVAQDERWILHDLFVAPAFRRRGVGQALMDFAMQFCTQRGAGGMFLLTEVINTTAQALYERSGWKRDEEFYRYVWKPAPPASPGRA